MLKTYGGVFIADVVGLGKTFISALLALQLDGRCLIIAPPSLLDENSPGSWPRVFRDFCIPGHKCVSIGKLEEVIDQGVEFYKYVFIDESHRFKGDSTQRYEHLTRIRTGAFKRSAALTPEDKKFVAAVHQIIADGRVGKATIRKVKEAFDKTDDPVAMLAILRKEIARQYLLGPTHQPGKDAPPAPREVILSSFLP